MNNISSSYNKLDKDIRKAKEAVIITVVFLISIVIAVTVAAYGGFSKLEYGKWENKKSVPLYISSSNYDDSGIILNEDSSWLKERMDKLAIQMTEFIKYKYGIDLLIPDYSVYITNRKNMGTVVIGNNLKVYVAKDKLSRKKENYETLLIHELFHVLTAQDGCTTRINNYSEYPSILIEGYTDILTDEFLDYMKYDDYVRIMPRSEYSYYSTICNIFFIENGMELKFARYYFLDDFSFTEMFNERVRNSSKTSFLYNPYDNMEMHLYEINEENKQKSSLLCTYELIAFYSSKMNYANKTKVETAFNKIDEYIDERISNGENIDYSYFHNVLWNKA